MKFLAFFGQKASREGVFSIFRASMRCEYGVPFIESISMIFKFRMVFSNLPSMPPDRDIDFCIDRELSNHPISIPPIK